MIWILRSAVPVTLACLLVAAVSSPAGSVLRQDKAWKTYLNREAGYCVSYPSRWFKSETYEGAGFAVTTGLKRHSSIPSGSIDVSALEEPETRLVSAPMDFDSDFDMQLAGLKKFVRAEQVDVLEKRTFALGTSPSLFAKIRYFDPRDRRLWVSEVIFANRQHVNYRLELEARADQLERFESIFAQFVNSFQMDCGGAGKLTAARSQMSRRFVLPNRWRAFEIACSSASSRVPAENLARHAPGDTLSAWHTNFAPTR